MNRTYSKCRGQDEVTVTDTTVPAPCEANRLPLVKGCVVDDSCDGPTLFDALKKV